jgi:hypothetical protein
MSRDDTNCGYLGCRNARIDAGAVGAGTDTPQCWVHTPLSYVYSATGTLVTNKTVCTAPSGPVTDGLILFSWSGLSADDTLHYTLVGW